MTTNNPVPERFAYTIPEVGHLLHLSRSTVYELINAELLDVIRIGRAVRVPRSSLAHFLGVPTEQLSAPLPAPVPPRPEESVAAALAVKPEPDEVRYLVTVKRLRP